MSAGFTFVKENLDFTMLRKFSSDSEISNENVPSIIDTLHNAIISLSIYTQLPIPQLEELGSWFKIAVTLVHWQLCSLESEKTCVPFDMDSNILLIQLLYACCMHAYSLSWIEFLNTSLGLICSIIICSTTFAALGELMVQREDGMAGKGYCSFAGRGLCRIHLGCVSERLISLGHGVV